VKTAKRREWTIDGHPVGAGDVRLFVFRRDRTCLAFQFDRTHACSNIWGRAHTPDDWSLLTLEHVPSVHSPSDVRRDDPEHLVTLCFGANADRHPSKDLRAFCRSYLLDRYPTCQG